MARRLAPALASAAVLVVGLLGSGTAVAQMPSLAKPAAAVLATAAASDNKLDEEAPDSPRVSMRAFYEYAERGRFVEAANYLDLSRGMEKRGPELASKLYAVLEERLLVNPEQLSPLSQGKPADGMPEGVEELGRIGDPKTRSVSIRIVHHEAKHPDEESRWVFSQATVGRIDQLYAGLRDRWMRDHLPAVLLTEGPLSLSYWQWIAIPLLAAFCLVPGRFLAWLGGRIARAFFGKVPWSQRLILRLERPTSAAWALALFVAIAPFLVLTLRAQDFVERGIRALAYLIFFWALVRAVVVVGDEIAHAEWASTRPSARALSSMGVKLGKVGVGALALMVALSELGYPVTSIVAGLGIGGIAIALAAQKTVENLFGSVALLADQPFRVGDTVRVDSIEGTVEMIGLRSTRLRTADRTLIVFPNGKLADMRIETLGARDRIRFATKLPLSRATSPATVERVVAEITAQLVAHARVRAADVFVRLIGIGEASYDVEVAAPVETTDYNEFARIREELLVMCVKVVETSGARLAVPTRELVGPAAAPVSRIA